MKPTRKQYAKKFREAIAPFLLSVGAKTGAPDKPVFLGYEFALETTCGELVLTVYDTWIAGRFSGDLERPVARLGNQDVNRFSGKFNHVYSTDTPVQDALASFKRSLSRILNNGGQ